MSLTDEVNGAILSQQPQKTNEAAHGPAGQEKNRMHSHYMTIVEERNITLESTMERTTKLWRAERDGAARLAFLEPFRFAERFVYHSNVMSNPLTTWRRVENVMAARSAGAASDNMSNWTDKALWGSFDAFDLAIRISAPDSTEPFLDDMFVKSLHSITVNDGYDNAMLAAGEYPGTFRKRDALMPDGDFGLDAPADDIYGLMKSLEYCTRREMSPIMQTPEDTQKAARYALFVASKYYCQFRAVRPFADGNGRVGRLLATMIVMRMGFTPPILVERKQDRYLRALRDWRNESNPLPMLVLMEEGRRNAFDLSDIPAPDLAGREHPLR